jgi:hypothetical protein
VRAAAQVPARDHRLQTRIARDTSSLQIASTKSLLASIALPLSLAITLNAFEIIRYEHPQHWNEILEFKIYGKTIGRAEIKVDPQIIQ